MVVPELLKNYEKYRDLVPDQGLNWYFAEALGTIRALYSTISSL